MGRTEFEVRFDTDVPEAGWTEGGIDSAECYLSANVGEEPGRWPGLPRAESFRV
jgi:hypothetical protein